MSSNRRHGACIMDLDTNTAAALLSAIRLALDQGGASAALAAAGIQLPEAARFDGLPGDLRDLLGGFATDKSVNEALALGFLAGRAAHRPRIRTLHDPTSFVMDRNLVVHAAEGESVLRLPWFDEALFVGRQLHDISEMPAPVRRLCVETYSAALDGERGRFAFTSYGHPYSVEAIPAVGEHGRVEAVLAIATPGRSFTPAATAYERTAERLDRSATVAERRADRHGRAGRPEPEAAERRGAAKARRGAERARANAYRLHARDSVSGVAEPSITPREAEVLTLASHGLTHAETAEQLTVSPATVRTHLENVYPKLGVSDKAAAVAAALRHGLID
jgi:DNA-binding CsgD family transcriptional regulator